jgi:hypothetical protein
VAVVFVFAVVVIAAPAVFIDTTISTDYPIQAFKSAKSEKRNDKQGLIS